MNQKPKTCVILVNYKGSKDTAACLASLAQSELAVTVILVDTSPNDPDLESILTPYRNVTLIRARDNIGFGRGNNLGIDWALKNSECEFIFLLNNDTTVLPDSIANLERAMSEQPGVGIFTPRIVYMHDPQVLWYGGGEIDWRRASAFTPKHNQGATDPLAMQERDVTFASGCALFFRKSVLKTLGGFDSRYFMYEEDLEICLRAGEQGMRIRYLPSSIILHRAQGASKEVGQDSEDFWSVKNPKLAFYAFHVIRNRMFTVFLHAHGLNLLKASIGLPLYIIRRSIPFILGGRVDAVFAMFRGAVDFYRTKDEVPVMDSAESIR